MNLNELTATEIAAGVSSKKFSAKDVAQAALDAIKKTNKELNAYISVLEESAQAQAQAIDKKIAAGQAVGLFEQWHEN